MKLSIKTKLLISFGALIILMFLLQLVFNLFFADEWYKQYKVLYMEEAYYRIEEAYDGDIDALIDMVIDMEETQSVRTMISCDGEIIYVTGGEYFTENQKLVRTPRDEEGTYGRIEEPRQNGNQIGGEKQPIPSQSEDTINLMGELEYGEAIIKLNMSVSVASIESTATFFMNANMVIALAILIVGVFVSLVVSRSITKPIHKIEKISCKLANLEFDELASEISNIKEISSLGRSVNQMSREISSRMDELSVLNKQLQKDVDYQKQMEQVRREFIANVSHEMKTPIAILQFYCENLKSDIPGLDKEYYYNTIIEETQRMDEMVKSLLDISFLENGLSKMDFEEMNFSEVTKHTVDKLDPLLEGYNLEIDIEQDLVVIGDKKFLEQAIKNYINNASSHTDDGGLICITLKKIEKVGMLSVYNEGHLIDDEKIERIWESFYKSDESRVRTDNTNVGLGLYIVKSIVENHGGTYGVENKEQGVEFRFSIPLL